MDERPVEGGMRRPAAVVFVLGAILLAVLFGFFWLGLNRQSNEIVGGTVDEVTTSQVVYLQEHGVFIVATDSGFVALSDDSRHVGDRVLYCRSDASFSSPAHGERFDRLGRYVGGPASGDLGRYQTRISDGQVLVDLTTLELPDRSANGDAPAGPRCEGQEDPAGFYDDGSS